MKKDSMLSVGQLLELIETGSTHVMLTDVDTGEVLISSIWWDDLESWFGYKVVSVSVLDYELRLGVR